MIFNRVLGPLAVSALAAAAPNPKLARRGTIASDEIGNIPFAIFRYQLSSEALFQLSLSIMRSPLVLIILLT
jgi:hypothetical protein